MGKKALVRVTVNETPQVIEQNAYLCHPPTIAYTSVSTTPTLDIIFGYFITAIAGMLYYSIHRRCKSQINPPLCIP